MDHRLADHCEFITALLAHDISNYNQTSRGYLEMLIEEQMGPLTEEQLRALTICLRQASRIQNLIESVRLVEEIAEKKPQLEPLELDTAIQEAITQIQNESADREIRVRFAAADRRALAEPYLSTVFMHLLNNGVRHNDSEIVEIEIHIAKRTHEKDGSDLWNIRITDNGEGISAAKANELFNRLDHKDMHGHGIGLSVVKKLLQRWGGEIWLEPDKGEFGAVFGLTLPAA